MLFYMNTKQLAKFLIDGKRNPDDYSFIIISDDITTEGKFKNVNMAQHLMPTPRIASLFINDGFSDEYQGEYFMWINRPENLSTIALIIKAVIKDKRDVILINSPSESTFGVLDMIARYIEQIYKLPVYSWKTIKKHPERIKELTDEEYKVCLGNFKDNINSLKKAGINIEPIVNPEYYLEGLKKMKKKELKRFCRDKSIFLTDDELDSKKLIIEKIMHRIQLI